VRELRCRVGTLRGALWSAVAERSGDTAFPHRGAAESGETHLRGPPEVQWCSGVRRYAARGSMFPTMRVGGAPHRAKAVSLPPHSIEHKREHAMEEAGAKRGHALRIDSSLTLRRLCAMFALI